jgi:cytochrome c oxidase subunit 1
VLHSRIPLCSSPDQSTATLPTRNYLNNEHGLLSWLLTQDRKRIGVLYLITITFFFFLGGVFAGLIRLELLTPQGVLLRRTRTTSSSQCMESS